MKTKILTLIGLSLFLDLFAQNQQPTGMNLIPQGSFNMKVIEKNETLNIPVSLDAFWMSNEITNLEYKEYINFIKQHPDSLMCWIDLENQMKNDTHKQIKCLKYSEIIGDIIDSTKTPYKDYLTNTKYNNYPVVGISYKHANFYCQWKTQMEINKIKKEDMLAIYSYTLPTEEQWAYVASQPQTEKRKNVQKREINPSLENDLNNWNLYNLPGNVSEWISLSPTNNIQKDLRIIRGGSWKTKSDINERKLVDKNTKEDYIGFRIVCAYLGNEK